MQRIVRVWYHLLQIPVNAAAAANSCHQCYLPVWRLRYAMQYAYYNITFSQIFGVDANRYNRRLLINANNRSFAKAIYVYLYYCNKWKIYIHFYNLIKSFISWFNQTWQLKVDVGLTMCLSSIFSTPVFVFRITPVQSVMDRQSHYASFCT